MVGTSVLVLNVPLEELMGWFIKVPLLSLPYDVVVIVLVNSVYKALKIASYFVYYSPSSSVTEAASLSLVKEGSLILTGAGNASSLFAGLVLSIQFSSVLQMQAV